MRNLKRIGINMISGGAGYLIPMIVNIFSTPFVLTNIGAEAYGLLTLANVIIGYLIVADMGLDIPITQKIAQYYAENDIVKKGKFLVGTVKIYFAIGLSGMLFVFVFTDELIRLLSIPSSINQEAKIIFYLAGLGFFSSVLNMWGKAVFNGLHRYDIANGISIFSNFFGIVLGVALIDQGYGVIGFFVARVVGFSLSNLAYSIFIWKHVIQANLFPFFDAEIWTMLKRQVGYGFALRMSGMIFSKMDQTLIGAWVAIAAVTAYSLPILIATALSGLIGSVTHFAFPMASSMKATHSLQEMQSFFIKLNKFVVLLSTLCFTPFIILGDKFLMLWINQDLAIESQMVLVMLLLAFYFNACFTIGLNAFVVGIGQLRFFTVYSLMRGLTLFAGFLILIKFYGMNGAGMAYLVSLIIDLIFVFYSLRRKLNFSALSSLKQSYLMPWIIGFVLGTGLFFVRDWVTTWISLVTAFAAFSVLYLTLALRLSVIDQKEKDMILSVLKRR